MENITRKQHFVPQFYLRQFVDEDGYLHCYKKEDGKHFHAHTNDVCFKEYGYEVENTFGNQRFLLPNEIEKMFRSLEGDYSTVLRSVVDKCRLNANGAALICTLREKETLASMVANFIARNFLAVDSFVDDKKTEALLRDNQEVVDVDNLLREMKMGDAKPLLELAQKKLFLCPSEEGVSKYIMDSLLGLDLSFFVTDTINFITCDCPVGYNCNSEELLMARIPLSTQVMAVYTSSKSSRRFRNRARLIEGKFVEKFNRDYLSWDVPQTLIAKSRDDILSLLK